MKKILTLLAGVLAILMTAYYAVVSFVVPGYIKQTLPAVEQLAGDYIYGSVRIGGINWNGGLSAEIDDVVVTGSEGETVAKLPKTVVTLRPWMALGDEPVKSVSRVELVQPLVYLSMDDDKQWNLQHFLKPSDSEETPFYGLLKITGGRLNVVMPCGEWDLGVEGTINGGANPKFAVDTVITSAGDSIELTGLVTTKGIGNFNLKTDVVNFADYAPVMQYYTDVRDFNGAVKDLRLILKNDGKSVRLSGEGKADNISGKAVINDAEHTFKADSFIYAADSIVTVKKLDAEIDGQKISFTGDIDLNNTDNIRVNGLLQAAELRYENVQARNIKIPFRFEDNALHIIGAEVGYGGGTITANGTYELEDKALIADAAFKNVQQSFQGRPEDNVSLNGNAAVLLKVKEDKTLLHAAAETFDLQWRSLHIDNIALDADLDGEKLNIEHFSALAGKGSLAASGSVGYDGALDIKGRMAEFPVNPFMEVAGQQGSGLCSTGFNIGGTLDAPAFVGVVQLTEVDFMQQKITEAHGRVEMRDNVLTLVDFGANMEQGRHVINGTVDLRKDEPVLDLAVETSNVRAEPLMAVAAPDVKITGNVDNVVQLRGTIPHLIVSGEVRLTDGSAEGYLLDKVQGRYVYNDSFLRLKDFKINTLSTEVVLDGSMTKDEQLDFTMAARNVSMARLPIMEKDFAIDGFVNADGKLSGTLKQPYFEGMVSSDELSINGEVLTELSGSLESNGRDVNRLQAEFKQPFENDNGFYGMYKADINLNLTQRFMQGQILTMWGNLRGILKMCKQDYDLDGLVQGEIEINKNGKGSGIDIKIWTDDFKVHDLNYHRMMFEGRILKNVMYFDSVKLIEQRGVEDRGIIRVDGSVNFAERSMDVKLEANKANPAIATAVMKDPPQITGEMDMLVRVNGTFDNPSGRGTLNIVNGAVSGVSVDSLTAALALENDCLSLKQMEAVKDVYSVKAQGDIPLDLFRDKAERRNANAQMQIVVDLDEARLGMLPAMTKMVEWGTGDTKGKVTIGGTLEEPLLNGFIKIEEGSVKLKDVNTVLDKIHTDIEFDGNKVILHDLSSQLGKGWVAIDGSYALRTSEKDTYRLHVKAENAELSSTIFTGVINSEMEIVPQRYFDFEHKNDKGEPTSAYRPLLKGGVKLDDVLVNMPTVPEMGEGSTNLGMDLQIDLGPKIHFFNKYLYDMWLSGNMYIKGSTVFPVIEGLIRADRGSVTYLRTPFKLKTATVAWPVSGTFLPTVNLESEARFSRYNIYMRVNGPVEEMDLQLTSNPPLDQNTIIRMLTLQREAGGSDDVSSEDMQNLMTAGLQMTVLGDVEMLVKQTLGLDQFRIYTGKVRSGIGFESVSDNGRELTAEERNQYNLLVSKYATDRLMLGYTTSFDAIDRSIFGQYDISKHLNITYSRSYDLSDEPEDWYGLEYKVSF